MEGVRIVMTAVAHPLLDLPLLGTESSCQHSSEPPSETNALLYVVVKKHTQKISSFLLKIYRTLLSLKLLWITLNIKKHI